METKSAFASKLNWLGILTAVAGLSALTDRVPPEVAKWLLVVSGVATIVLRTFFTNTVIK